MKHGFRPEGEREKRRLENPAQIERNPNADK